MGELDFYKLPDGATLKKLDNGLEITRRRKHEWKPDLDGMDKKSLAAKTDKYWGSKFYRNWTIEAVLAQIELVVAEEGWTLQPGNPTRAFRHFGEGIGLVAGIEVRIAYNVRSV